MMGNKYTKINGNNFNANASVSSHRELFGMGFFSLFLGKWYQTTTTKNNSIHFVEFLVNKFKYIVPSSFIYCNCKLIVFSLALSHSVAQGRYDMLEPYSCQLHTQTLRCEWTERKRKRIKLSCKNNSKTANTTYLYSYVCTYLCVFVYETI